jgi:hypothetical protein
MVQKQKGAQQGRSDFFSILHSIARLLATLWLKLFTRDTFESSKLLREFEFQLFRLLCPKKNRLRRKT